MAGGAEQFIGANLGNGPEPVAIIGMACLFPQAGDLAAFWRNIVGGVDAVGDPQTAWDAERYLRSGRVKTPCGGYLKDLYRFDPREFGIMPNSLDGGEPDQYLALRIARDALQDAGYLRGDYDHQDTGIILGHSTYLHRGQGTLIQNHIVVDQTLEVLRAALPSLDDAGLGEIRRLLEGKLPAPTPDIAPGLVPNVMTGRIANRLDLKGPNYLVDAACSSSLLAVNAAIDELRAGRSRMMLAGGVNASLPAEVAVIFTQLGALSGRGKVRPFEAGSDGTLLGEGLGVVVLKRLADALADSDRIYAVIRGVGQASDGRGHGLLAPSVEGETLAIRRAYGSSRIDPASIGLIEAHGTGIPLGDKTEIAALRNVFGERRGTGGSIALGSVKSMISHCIPAAGIAGLIKSALALHHKILPPTLCERINPELEIGRTPFYINTQAAPWISRVGEPRRAGINSFGFGGINTHAIVEEAPREAGRPLQLTAWPVELCVFSADSREALSARLQDLVDTLDGGTPWSLAEIAAALAAGDRHQRHRLALVARDADELRKQLGQALKKLADTADRSWATRGGSHYCEETLAGRLAFLFPGEGSQYLGMLAELALHFDEVRSWFDFWRSLYDEPPGDGRTDIVFPPATELTDERRTALEQRLNAMDVGSEAVFIGAQAMNALLLALGIEPDVMLGHSSGESSALAASRAIEAESPSELAGFIRRLNQTYERVLGEDKIPTGALLTVGAIPFEVIDAQIAAQGGTAVVAMDNCANQVVLYGDTGAIAELQASLGAAGGICMPLPFDRGYHTPAFAEVSAAFHGFYREIGLGSPKLPLYSCAAVDVFPEDPGAVRDLAAAQWSTRVRFRETLAKMHDDGVRYFVEVGPSGNLTAFVNDILSGREHVALATNQRRRGGLEQFLKAVAELYVHGRAGNLQRLFSARRIAAIDLASGAPAAAPGMLLDNTLPMVRLDAADRETLRRLAGAAAADPQPQAAALDVAAEAAAGGGTDTERLDDVMADYFTTMRTFLDRHSAVMAQWQSTGAPETDAAQAVVMPFLDTLLEADERHLRAVCRVGLHSDEFLRDHVLSGPVSAYEPDLLGLSCIPLAVSLEIMAEACAVLAGDTGLRVIENVKAFDWIALDAGKTELEVRAELLDADRRAYRASIVTEAGLAISAEYVFTPEWRCAGLPPLAELRAPRWNGPELYATGMFHGPLFQSIRHIDGWDGAGMDARLSPVSLQGFFSAGETPRLVLNPVLLDAAGQLAAYWIAEQIGTDFNCFPSSIGRIELYRECPADVPGLALRARQGALDPADDGIDAPRAWHFDAVDDAGNPLVRISHLVNVFFPVPNRFYQVRRDPLNGRLGHVAAVAGKPGITLWALPNLSEEFCGQSGGIFLRILAHVYLGQDERQQWQALTANPRRRREWLLGRASIKEAVRHWIHAQTGQPVHPADIVVHHDPAGAPFVDGWWCDSLVPAPEVSLSHNARVNMAAVSAPQMPVGVDIEDIDRLQQPDLLIDVLSGSEKKALGRADAPEVKERLLRLWCAKEAAAKFLGTGLRGRPEDFEVRFDDERMEEGIVVHAGSQIDVSVHRDGDLIVALACGRNSAVGVH
jgi:acyl transferase domain-containing protein/phosphopantetheinyl transferase